MAGPASNPQTPEGLPSSAVEPTQPLTSESGPELVEPAGKQAPGGPADPPDTHAPDPIHRTRPPAAVTPPARRRAAPYTGDVEIRIHGVSGTPPAELLDRADVRQVAGDRIAGFFRPAVPDLQRDRPSRAGPGSDPAAPGPMAGGLLLGRLDLGCPKSGVVAGPRPVRAGQRRATNAAARSGRRRAGRSAHQDATGRTGRSRRRRWSPASDSSAAARRWCCGSSRSRSRPRWCSGWRSSAWSRSARGAR